MSLSKLLKKCISNFIIIVNCKINCKINCKTIYINFLLMFSCFLYLNIAFNLTLLLNNNFFFKLIISKLCLHVKLKLNFKEEIILHCSFFIIKDDDLNLLFNLKFVTNYHNFSLVKFILTSLSWLVSIESNVNWEIHICSQLLFCNYLSFLAFIF